MPGIAYSWDFVLKPHRRATDQPKTKIDVVCGPAEGRFAKARQVAQSIRLLETVADHAADDFVWPAPFTLEMQSCGSPNAGWDPSTRKLMVCYELARDFAGLYRGYGDMLASWQHEDSEQLETQSNRFGIQTEPPANSAQATQLRNSHWQSARFYEGQPPPAYYQ